MSFLYGFNLSCFVCFFKWFQSFLFLSYQICDAIFVNAETTVFQAQPPTPPSAAQEATQSPIESSPFLHSIKRLFLNVNYILLLISYGMNVGVFYAISTLLNRVSKHSKCFLILTFGRFHFVRSQHTLKKTMMHENNNSFKYESKYSDEHCFNGTN